MEIGRASLMSQAQSLMGLVSRDIGKLAGTAIGRQAGEILGQLVRSAFDGPRALPVLPPTHRFPSPIQHQGLGQQLRQLGILFQTIGEVLNSLGKLIGNNRGMNNFPIQFPLPGFPGGGPTTLPAVGTPGAGGPTILPAVGTPGGSPYNLPGLFGAGSAPTIGGNPGAGGSPYNLPGLFGTGSAPTIGGGVPSGGGSNLADKAKAQNWQYLDDRQKANLALQEASQKQSEAAALITTLMKMLHDTLQQLIQNMK